MLDFDRARVWGREDANGAADMRLMLPRSDQIFLNRDQAEMQRAQESDAAEKALKLKEYKARAES